MLQTVLLSALTFAVLAHPTFYPHVNPVDLTESSFAPEIFSWHIHLLYSFVDEDIADALAIREEVRAFLQPYMIPGKEDCHGIFDQGRLCICSDHDHVGMDVSRAAHNGGPFPSGEWSLFVPTPYIGIAYPWMMQNRGRFSVLLHPNSGYMYEDHSIWATWTGQSWPLKLYPEIIGSPGEQTGEISHTPGDEANPLCIPDNMVCGADGLVQGTCCGGSSCQCTSQYCFCQAN